MLGSQCGRRWAMAAVIGAAVLAGPGCFHTNQGIVGPEPMVMGSPPTPPPIAVPPEDAVPRELSKRVLPPYVIEAPDTLLIEVIQQGKFPIPSPDPTKPGQNVKDPDNPKLDLLVPGTQRLTIQPISGNFLVRVDGTVGLGYWGSVRVAGLTLEQAAEAIRQHLLEHKTLKEATIKPDNLIVIIDVLAYNSKRYYVVLDGGGYGEQVYPFPITGSECVLDALANVNGLQTVASKRNIWLARRCPIPNQPYQIFPVDWIGIVQHGQTMTNYQIMPGDRIYVKAQSIVTFDTALARFISPVERLFGITLLGVNTVNQFKSTAATSTGQ